MFPVISKDRISHTESYPIGAQQISAALGDVPQAPVLAITFGRGQAIRGYATQWKARDADSDWRYRTLFRVSYRRRKLDFSTSNIAIERGALDPRWEIWVWSVPRQWRHRINELLVTEALPKIRDWLLARSSIHGEFTSENRLVLFDREKEVLSYE